MLSLEASLRGLKSLLIEQNDFGWFTSFNSMRIVHGGFRYLQKLDIKRLRESMGERQWFVQNFPDLVSPLPCLMPIYGRGLKRKFILRLALLFYDCLYHMRKNDNQFELIIPSGTIIDTDNTRERFPAVDEKGLQGGAIWYDAFVPDSQRLLINALRWSCGHGATALNYVKAIKLMKSAQKVEGVIAVDNESGKTFEYKAGIVINAGGPWCRELAADFDRDVPTLFQGMLAWNILFKRNALSEYGLAVTSQKSPGHTYFIVPWKGMLFAGTGHAKWQKDKKNPMPSTEQINEFIDDLNVTIPSLYLKRDEIIRVFPGLEPASREGGTDFATRETILDHSKTGGPDGLYSLSGVKFTTSRLVAEKVLNMVFPDIKISAEKRNENMGSAKEFKNTNGIINVALRLSDKCSGLKDELKSIIENESVEHLDDLYFRRTNLWEDTSKSLELLPLICDLFGWDDDRCERETVRLKEKLTVSY